MPRPAASGNIAVEPWAHVNFTRATHASFSNDGARRTAGRVVLSRAPPDRRSPHSCTAPFAPTQPALIRAAAAGRPTATCMPSSRAADAVSGPAEASRRAASFCLRRRPRSLARRRCKCDRSRPDVTSVRVCLIPSSQCKTKRQARAQQDRETTN
jgi:hypothetical protein